MSHDEGSSKPTEADGVTDDDAPSLRDTQPGVPAEMELSRTLPTGAAFHMTWRSPHPQIVLPNTPATPIVNANEEAGAVTDVLAMADTQPLEKSDAPRAMPNTPASLPKAQAATAKTPVPPPADGQGPLGTTRREFGGRPVENKPGSKPAKLSPREKARRNMLTHTLQMPLVIAPLHQQQQQPTAAPRTTVRQGSVPAQGASPSPHPGWTSMQRVGSDASEPTSSRPAPRHTDPLLSTMLTGSAPAESRRPTSMHDLPTGAEPSARPEQQPPSWQRVAASTTTQEVPAHWVTRMSTGDFDRTTLPDVAAIRIPALNAREWMFIGLLACASAATLYSLLVDDVATEVEEDSDAATTIEHVVTPAEPPVQAAPKPSAASPAAAATAYTTEIVSDPPHAEVVLGGAVIGNTPAQVVRGSKEADYLLRKQGYEPQLVRVTPHSGKSISITLRPKQP